ncbi:MAG: PspC domain-containing protein, partial [Proteobacteria bacterium]|nr:PspC domain-containing protein [Pseudomonadota bacterium]
MTDYSPRKLYRNTRDAKLMGVCAGLADYLDVRTCVIRILTIL